MIVIVGDRADKGNSFGVNIIMASKSTPVKNLCILKGGIDAVKVEHPHLLAKTTSAQASEQ